MRCRKFWTRFFPNPKRDRRTGRPRGRCRPLFAEPLEDRTVPTGVFFTPMSAYQANNFGGPIIPNVDVELIFWGAAWNQNPGLIAGMQDAVANIVTGPYMSRLAQYGVGNGQLAHSDLITDSSPPANFTIADVQLMLRTYIQGGALPDPATDLQRFYFVVTQPGSAFMGGEAGGYHDYAISPLDGITHYRYGLEGNLALPGYTYLDYMTTLFSHELVEGVTDPEGRTNAAWQLLPGGGDKELCDLDAQQYTYRVDGLQYLVQSYWSDIDHNFAVPTGTAQDFLLTNDTMYGHGQRTLYVVGNQLADPTDQIRLDLTLQGGVLVTLNGEVAQFDPTIFFFGGANIRAIAVNSGTGTNTVTIASSNTPITVDMRLGTGPMGDTLNVGDPTIGLLDLIQGPVNMLSQPGDINLVVNDQADPINDMYTITNSQVARARGNILITYLNLNSLTLNTGAGPDTITVASTAVGMTTTVNMPGNTAYLLNVGNPGNGLLDNIQGPLIANSAAGTVNLVLNDQSNNRNGDTYTVTDSSVIRTNGFRFTYNLVNSLTLNAGSGNDTITVESTDQGTQTAVNTGPARQTVNIGDPAGGLLDNIRGPLTVTSQAGAADLIFNDQLDPNNDQYILTSTTLTRPGVAFTYTNVHSLTLNAGAGNDTITVRSVPAGVPVTLVGGGGNTTVEVPQGAISTASITFINIQTLWIDGGTVNVTANLALPNFLFDQGTLTGPNTFTVTTQATWNGGTMNGAGQTTIAAGATLNLNGGVLDMRTLENDGTLNWNNAALGGAGTIQNNGTLSGSGSFTGTLVNAGQVNPGGVGATGVLSVGTYTQTAAGVLNIEIGGYGAGGRLRSAQRHRAG